MKVLSARSFWLVGLEMDRNDRKVVFRDEDVEV